MTFSRHQDALGHALSGANPQAIDFFEQASHELRCLVADPLATATKALAESPDFTMAHALVAWLYLLGTEPGAIAPARAALEAAQALPADEREAMHLGAIEHVVNGRWHAAGVLLEDLSIRWPRDALALQVGHQIDFFTAPFAHAARPHRARRIAGMAGPACRATTRCCRMHAFGLEENGRLRARRSTGAAQRRTLEPRDGWGWHAVAHVMEMQNRRRDGVAWLGSDGRESLERRQLLCRSTTGGTWRCSTYGLEQIDEVLALVDERISAIALAAGAGHDRRSAMLWRLQLSGIDVGDRWQRAGRTLGRGHRRRSTYAFNDMRTR